ncbi:MAG: chemotaxis protein CheW [Cyanobacteria bacterium P01_C01_bin.118]
MTTQALINTEQTLKLIVMNLGPLTIACRIKSVYKVVRQVQIHSSGLGHTGITHLDDQAVTVVDLHQKLFKVSMPAEAEGYFVILSTQSGNLIAIPVAKSPNLMDVRCDQIKVLPNSYRHSDTLSIASHIAIIPNEKKSLTVFLLDENTLL